MASLTVGQSPGAPPRPNAEHALCHRLQGLAGDGVDIDRQVVSLSP